MTGRGDTCGIGEVSMASSLISIGRGDGSRGCGSGRGDGIVTGDGWAGSLTTSDGGFLPHLQTAVS